MASMEFKIEAGIHWKKGNEVIPCTFCEDLIISGSHELVITMNKKPVKMQSKIIVCNSCYDVIKV